jgi:nucleotide-binding universal stress UspA family protein
MTTFSVLMDFTAAADHALRYAGRLAAHLISRQRPAELRLLALLPDPAEAEYFPAAARFDPTDLVAYLAAAAAALPAVVPCRTVLLTGPVGPRLAATLRAPAPGLLVLGRPEAPVRAASSPILYLCRLVQHPLLVVPAGFAAATPAPTRLALDTDGLPVRLPPTAEPLAELMSSLRPHNHVHYLGAGPRAAEQLLRQLRPQTVGIHVYTATEPAPAPASVLARLAEIGLLAGLPHTLDLACHPSVEEGILQVAHAHRADLLACVARQQSLPEPAFYRSPSAGLMLRSPIPTLVVPEAAPVPWTRCA